MKSILILFILVYSRPANAEEFSRIWLGKDLWPFGGSKYPGGSEYKSSGNWRSMPGVILGFHYGGKGPLPKPVELSIPLKKPLPLGSYRLFVKNFYRGRMEATVGDITRPLTIRRYDWTPGVTFESNAPIDRIVLRYFPDGTGGVVPETGAKQERYYIVQGLFLTTANNKVPVREGEIISILPQELPPIVDGNLIANASFEAGIHPWGKAFGSQHFITHGYLDETDGAVGKASLRFRKRKSFGLETPLIRMRPGKHSLSFYAKADQPVRVTARLLGISEDLKKYAGTGLGKSFSIGKQWQRFSVTAEVLPRTGLLYTLLLTGKTDGPVDVWFDGIQLERGELSDFAARGTEVGFTCTAIGHIFYAGESGTIDILLSDPKRTEASVDCRTTDYWGEEVDKRRLAGELTKGRGKISFQPFQEKTGLFRLSLSVGNAAAEFLYSVVPRNRHLNQKYPQGTLGTDSGFVPENLAILKRANFNWLITKFLGRWYVVEPERDRYQFNDAAIAATDSNHLSVVIQFLNPSWGIQKWLKPFSKPRGGAVWATEKKQTFMNEWQQMVSETVSHYRASVGDWEIWNEPNAAFGAAEYGEILKLAAQSIRKADPRARIVGFSGGGFNTKFYDEVLRRAGADSFDVASVHFYGNQLETHRAYDSFLKRTGKPGWNTETGASCPTSFTTLPDFESLRVKDHWAHLQNEVRRVTENSVKNYLISLSVGGMERYFHYFARMGNCSPSQPTRWFGSGKEINEFDGSLRANGVGLCIASHFIDGSKYHGPVVLDDRLQVHLFKRTEGCVGYLYSVSDKLEIPQSKNMNLQFHDIMGNRLPGDRISIGSSPVYFTTELDAAESIRTLNSLSGDE